MLSTTFAVFLLCAIQALRLWAEPPVNKVAGIFFFVLALVCMILCVVPAVGVAR